MTGEPAFLDTNIIVYAYDKNEPKKQLKCLKIVERCFKGEKELYISNQILAELSFVLLNKIENPLPEKEVREIIEEFNISNGRTLCIDCHKLTDTYGRKAIIMRKNLTNLKNE